MRSFVNNPVNFNLVLYKDEILVALGENGISLPSAEHISKIEDQVQIVKKSETEFISFINNLALKELIENNLQLQFMNLRTVLGVLDQSLLSQALYYKSLVNYYQQKFCGFCGHPLKPQKHNKFLHCSTCNHEIYPHIAPSIIVRITKADRILLARNINFAPNIWSLIAGYVEIGETLEEAVHREVFEEVGLKIKNLKYFGSQPWPFAGISLMLGFTAEYASGEINLQEDEIAEAGFFTKDNLPGLPSSKISIAHTMINDFIG